jgi:Flp pilus assembly protein TadG
MKVPSRSIKPNRRRGQIISEAVAAMVIMIPLAFLLIFATVETSYALLIKSSMAQAAREGARSLAIAYGIDPYIVGDRAKENAQVFDFIRIHNMVNSSEQFGDPTFNTNVEPHTVTVTVTYTGGQNNLPDFPFPDPLKLGDRYVISASSTYRLE